MTINIVPKTLATGTNNSNKQISKNAWNAGHKMTGGAYKAPVFDANGVLVERDAVLTPFDFGAVGDNATDDSAALQALFDYVSANPVKNIDLTGTFAVASPVDFGPESGTSPSLHFSGRCSITATAEMLYVIKLRNLGAATWRGALNARGTGSASFASRTCGVGVWIEDCARMRFTGGVSGRNCWFAGVYIPDGSSLIDIGVSKAFDCGSGHKAGATNYGLTGTWSNPVNNGSASSTAQSTTISVDTMFPADLETIIANLTPGGYPIQIRIGGYLYWVKAADRNAGTINIYPWLPSTATPSAYEWVFGAAVETWGNDTNVIKFDCIDAIRCGRAAQFSGLYGPQGKRILGQVCGTVLQFGLTPSSACLGAEIGGVYCETSEEHVCSLPRQGTNNYNRISSGYGIDLAKCFMLGAPRTANDSLSSPGLSNTTLPYNAGLLEYEKAPLTNAAASTYTLTIDRRAQYVCFPGKNSWTINIAELPADLNRLYGLTGARIRFIGTGEGGAPTGSFTFNPPSGGTVNGTTDAVFSSFTGPVEFDAECLDTTPGAQVWVVYKFGG